VAWSGEWTERDIESPMALLKELPATVVLERFPVPVLAIAEDGAILFASKAFAEMLGYPADTVTTFAVSANLPHSALLRGDDPVALATFQDLTERLWVDEL
jgi:PAS domain-containing protein